MEGTSEGHGHGAAKKTLLTVLVDVPGGKEQLLVPFPAEKTVADLLEEVKRRVGFCAGSPTQPVEVLRAGGPDGPRLYCEDTLDAIVGLTTMFFAGSAASAAPALSPPACGLASPDTACSSSPPVASQSPPCDRPERPVDGVARVLFRP